jgi:hypothetical protein
MLATTTKYITWQPQMDAVGAVNEGVNESKDEKPSKPGGPPS